MTDSTKQVPLDYRPRPRGEGPAWFSRDKFAELCVGLAWTCCGCALLIVGLGWLFYHLDPPNAPWRVFAAVVVAVDTLGVAFAAAALVLGARKDALLLGVLVVALVMGAAAYGAAYGLAVRGRAASPAARNVSPQVPTRPPVASDGPDDPTP